MGRQYFHPRAQAILRGMATETLTDVAVIWGTEQNGDDGPVVKVVYDEGVPCRLAPLDLRIPEERRAAEQFGTDMKWTVIFEAGMRVPSNRRILVTGVTAGVPWEQHLEVLGELLDSSEMYHRVPCKTLIEAKIQQYYET